eukprot:11193089-Ditylum_brightwellii.AAC.1
MKSTDSSQFYHQESSTFIKVVHPSNNADKLTSINVETVQLVSQSAASPTTPTSTPITVSSSQPSVKETESTQLTHHEYPPSQQVVTPSITANLSEISDD